MNFQFHQYSWVILLLCFQLPSLYIFFILFPLSTFDFDYWHVNKLLKPWNCLFLLLVIYYFSLHGSEFIPLWVLICWNVCNAYISLFISRELLKIDNVKKRSVRNWRLVELFTFSIFWYISQNTIMINQRSDYIFFAFLEWLFLGHWVSFLSLTQLTLFFNLFACRI
jgi:hypothetical protein